jgi:hypothetical protein
MKLLAKNAGNRYQTAIGVEADLQECFGEWESRGRIEVFRRCEEKSIQLKNRPAYIREWVARERR